MWTQASLLKSSRTIAKWTLLISPKPHVLLVCNYTTAGVYCNGNGLDELKLTATLHELIVSCDGQKTAAYHGMYLDALCGGNFTDLIDDNQCSATILRKENEDESNMCYDYSEAVCSGLKCTASLDEVTVTSSIAQDDPSCLYTNS